MKRYIYLTALLIISAAALAQPEQEGIDSVRNNRVVIYPGFGVGLIRNELAPAFHINLGFNHRNRYEANVNTSSYFFFEKGTDNNYNIHRNTFLNAEFLLNFSPLSRNLKNWNGLGIGYMIESRGNYFRDPTMLFYYKRKIGIISVTPGLIFDDSFKDVWPVISIRL